ncbi:MAG: HAD family hydrolase, partial [Okeania sp. SIO2H7]|nr:HAD family hydrolase [Okeania sp. SIO2H7]
DRVVAMMGQAKRLVFETLWAEQLGADNSDYQAKVEESYQQFKEILERHYLTEPVEPTEGCLEIFQWLKERGIKIALNTGFYRKVTNIILNRLGLDKDLNEDYIGSENSIINASVTPSEIYNNEGRPAPYMLQKSMYELGVKDPQKVIVLGDTPSDIQAGINANCRLSLGVTYGTHTKEQLMSYARDGLIDSLLELKEIIVNC